MSATELSRYTARMNAGDPHRFSHDHDAAVRGGARGKIFGLASIDKWNLAFCWISAFVLFLILLQFTPRVANTSYLPDGKNQLWQTSYLPLSVTTKASGATVHTSLLLGSPHPSLLLVAASSCPTQISIDGIPVPPSAITCSKSGGILALSHFLHRGSNDFSAEIAASHGRVTFTITSAPADPLQLILFLLLFATLLGGVLLSIRPSIKRGNIPTLLLIFVGGTMLRFLYVLSTTYNVRSYDWVGHVEYIRYILQNLAVPPPTGGWQFYHPPLYYTLAALWGSLGWMMGKDPARLIHKRIFGYPLTIIFV